MNEFFIVLWWMLVSHAVCDFSLQTPAMATGKNRHNKVDPPVGQKYMPCWMYWLTSHALIHGGGAALVTGNVFLGLFIFVTHWITDFFKCDNKFNPNVDQFLHILQILVVAFIFSMLYN